MKLYEPNLPSDQTEMLDWSEFESNEDIPTNKPILVEAEDNETKEKSQYVLLGALNEHFFENNTVLRFSQLTVNMAKQSTRSKKAEADLQISMF